MRRVALFTLALLLGGSAAADAQVLDSARVGAKRPPAADSARRAVPDSELPPISAKRAFLTSLLIPGYAQTRLQRPSAAMLFAVVEVLSIGMARKAAGDLSEAKLSPRDSVVGSYALDASGHVVLDENGKPVPASYITGRFTDDRVNARRVHYEDWIAAIVFNHLFSAADAYVAAHLWDFRANIGATVSNGPRPDARIGATIAW